jgi:ElaB/YqjD/DUF883 family membrane-anchored ribosome-binding protein
MDMEQEVTEMGQDIAAGAEGLKEKWNRGTEAAKRYAGQAGDKAKEYASKAKDMTEKQIQEKPFYSMLVAMGVGMALGLVVGCLASSKSESYEY